MQVIIKFDKVEIDEKFNYSVLLIYLNILNLFFNEEYPLGG